ncbi:MAG: serine/threonine protein phosphatase [Silicimonas sp.]|nr:serine/threonine protein phosphatase [Silicimonas sp.]
MIYAIGDIHGQLAQLENAHALIARDKAVHGAEDAVVVHVGDLVDRGHDSRGVIDHLIAGRDAGDDWLVLRGNHDQLFLNFLNGNDGSDPRLRRGVTWQGSAMGGAATLASYGVERKILERESSFEARARSAVPDAHRSFIENLPLWFRAEDVLFVHAGIRPGFPIEAQDEDDLMWIRNDFLWHMGPHENLIVHGHTPVEEPTHYGNRINIDCGAGWGHALVPVVLDGGACFALTEEGRTPVKAPNEYYQ